MISSYVGYWLAALVLAFAFLGFWASGWKTRWDYEEIARQNQERDELIENFAARVVR